MNTNDRETNEIIRIPMEHRSIDARSKIILENNIWCSPDQGNMIKDLGLPSHLFSSKTKN